MLVVHHIRRPGLTPKVNCTSKNKISADYMWSYLRTICGYLRIPVWICVLPGCFYNTPLRSYPQKSEKESEVHKTCHAGDHEDRWQRLGCTKKRSPDCLNRLGASSPSPIPRATSVSLDHPWLQGYRYHPLHEPFRGSILQMAVRLNTCSNNPSARMVDETLAISIKSRGFPGCSG